MILCAEPKLAAGGNGGRDTDGIVEGQTKGFVDIFTALAPIEEVLLNVLDDRNKRTAGRVGSDSAVRACGPRNEGTCSPEHKPTFSIPKSPELD